MERLFMFAAALFACAAAYFIVWRPFADAAFASAVIAASAFFLAMRFRIKTRVDERNAAKRPTADGQNP